jgi:hypothetical protein
VLVDLAAVLLGDEHVEGLVVSLKAGESPSAFKSMNSTPLSDELLKAEKKDGYSNKITIRIKLFNFQGLLCKPEIDESLFLLSGPSKDQS